MKIIAVISLVAGLFLPLGAAAQEPVTPNQPADACKAIPYSIQVKEAGLEVSLKLLDAARRNLPKVEGTVGGEILRSAYSAMGQQVISEVIDWYSCKIKAYIKTQNPDNADDLISKIEAAQGDLERKMGLYFSAYASNDRAALDKYDKELSNLVRKESDPSIDVSLYFDKAIGALDLDKTFTTKSLVTTWVKVKFPAGTVSACGGYVLAALMEDPGPLQRSAMSAYSIFRIYLDGTNKLGTRNALSKLYNQASTASKPIAPISAPAKGLFQECTNEVASTIKS